MRVYYINIVYPHQKVSVKKSGNLEKIEKIVLTKGGSCGNLSKLSARADGGSEKIRQSLKKVLTNAESCGNISNVPPLKRERDVYLVN